MSNVVPAPSGDVLENKEVIGVPNVTFLFGHNSRKYALSKSGRTLKVINVLMESKVTEGSLLPGHHLKELEGRIGSIMTQKMSNFSDLLRELHSRGAMGKNHEKTFSPAVLQSE